MATTLIIKIVCTLAYMCFEYWLGKTDKVKSGSLLELGLNMAKTVLGTIKK